MEDYEKIYFISAYYLSIYSFQEDPLMPWFQISLHADESV